MLLNLGIISIFLLFLRRFFRSVIHLDFSLKESEVEFFFFFCFCLRLVIEVLSRIVYFLPIVFYLSKFFKYNLFSIYHKLTNPIALSIYISGIISFAKEDFEKRGRNRYCRPINAKSAYQSLIVPFYQPPTS